MIPGRLLDFGLSASVSAGALVLLALAVAPFLRRRWPGLAGGLFALAFAKLVFPPIGVGPIGAVAESALPAPDLPPADDAVAGWLLTAWATGLVLIAAWRLRAGRAARAGLTAVSTPVAADRALRRAADALGLGRTPRLLVVAEDIGPAVIGVLRPVVILPASAFGRAGADELELVLTHELAHVRRRDPLREAALTAVQLLYWFHPLLWLARRRIRDLRELACDATVAVALGDRTPAYRRVLARAAGRRLGVPAGAQALIGGGASILTRLDHLDRRPWRRARTRRALGAVLLASAAVLALPSSPRPAPLAPLAPHVSAASQPLPAMGCLKIRYAWLARHRE